MLGLVDRTNCNPEDCDKYHRFKLVLACQNEPLLNVTGACDAGFVQYVQLGNDPGVMELLMVKTYGPMRPGVSLKKHMDYKYIA